MLWLRPGRRLRLGERLAAAIYDPREERLVVAMLAWPR